VLGSTLVTFDSVIAIYLSGTAYTHPQYSDFTEINNWNDVGVVVLDKPARGITLARSRSSTPPSSTWSATAPRCASPTPGRRSRGR
jgi:hypothetical protein